MKTEANERGTIEQGFKKAEDGWHAVVFLEGIAPLMKGTGDEQEEVHTKQGDLTWKIPMEVTDEEDDSNEIGIDVLLSENARGEQMLVDFLGATSLFEKFQKAFPGDISIFAKDPMNKVKQRLPGQFMRVKTEQNEYKDGKGNSQIAVNLIGYGKMTDSVKELESTLFPAKKGAADQDGGSGKLPEDKKGADADNDDDW